MNNCRFDDTDHSQVLIHEEWPVVWHQPKCHSASSHHWSKASLGRGYQGTHPSHPQFRLSTAAIFCPCTHLYPKNGLDIFRALPSACAARSSELLRTRTQDNSCSEIERDAQITESTWNQPWNQPWNQKNASRLWGCASLRAAGDGFWLHRWRSVCVPSLLAFASQVGKWIC